MGSLVYIYIAKSLKSNLTITRLYITCAGNVDKHIKAVYQARRDKKLGPFKVFNDYSKEAELSAKELADVRSFDGKFSQLQVPTSTISSLQYRDEATLLPLLPSPSYPSYELPDGATLQPCLPSPSYPSYELPEMSQNDLFEAFIINNILGKHSFTKEQ